MSKNLVRSDCRLNQMRKVRANQVGVFPEDRAGMRIHHLLAGFSTERHRGSAQGPTATCAGVEPTAGVEEFFNCASGTTRCGSASHRRLSSTQPPVLCEQPMVALYRSAPNSTLPKQERATTSGAPCMPPRRQRLALQSQIRSLARPPKPLKFAPKSR